MASSTDKTIGFIILRHVNKPITDQYWIKCYDSIRRFYAENSIIIIDDDSDKELISKKELYKTTVIYSEFPKRGEILPYYYYLKNRLFDIAVIIHDSVFIQKYMDFNVDTYRILWEFEHDWDQHEDEMRMIKVFEDEALKNFYNDKKLWNGCFGGMSAISYDYLDSVNKLYNLNKLLDLVLTRFNRCSFERVIAVLLSINSKQPSFFGYIHKYIPYWTPYEETEKYRHLPVLKVWTSR